MESSPAIPLRSARTFGVRAAAALVGLMAAGGGLVGCQSHQQANRDIYYRELRLQEDEIYRLEDCIQEYQSLIRGYRIEIDQLKSQLAESPAERGPAGATSEPRDSDNGRSLLDSPGAFRSPERIDDADDDAPDITPPLIDMGEPTDAPPPLEPPPAIEPLDDRPPLIETPLPLDPSTRNQRYETLPSPGVTPLDDAPHWDNEAPATSAIDSQPLGSMKIRGYAGPEIETGEATLVALIRPASTTGQPSRFNGGVTLLLVDASADNARQKLARWDFSAEEVAEYWRTDTREPVLDLAVVLPQDTPMDREVELWLRAEDDHGASVTEKTVLVLGKLADVQTAKFAMADEPAQDQPPSGWRRSNRKPPESSTRALAHEPAKSDSGWEEASAMAPKKTPSVNLASHEEPPAAPRTPSWSPNR